MILSRSKVSEISYHYDPVLVPIKNSKNGNFLFRVPNSCNGLMGKIVPSGFNDAVDSALNRELLYFNIETSMLNQELVCFHTHNRAPAGVWSDMLIVKHF